MKSIMSKTFLRWRPSETCCQTFFETPDNFAYKNRIRVVFRRVSRPTGFWDIRLVCARRSPVKPFTRTRGADGCRTKSASLQTHRGNVMLLPCASKGLQPTIVHRVTVHQPQKRFTVFVRFRCTSANRHGTTCLNQSLNSLSGITNGVGKGHQKSCRTGFRCLLLQ